ncbi:MAG: CDP-alcohol phosphatidyltransferase family protein [Anaerolineae bacterium]|nr:CDP-alcohol phosphatidyltransferase family protein [Chloroflexota bacterium]
MANAITLSRFPLLVLIVLLLSSASHGAHVAAVPLVVLLILLDTVDGLVARARGEESLLGSVLDIMADRSVELVLWVVYAYVRLVPLAIPVIFVLRGTIVDSLRAVGVRQGTKPFGSNTSRLGRALVASPVMRTGYALAKVLAFALLALTAAVQPAGWASSRIAEPGTLWTVARAASWIATLFCIVRGVPVIVETLPRLMSQSNNSEQAQ